MPVLQRFKSAAFGSAITLLPIAALACVHFLLAPDIVAAVYMIDPQTEDWAVSALRRVLVRDYSIIALIIAAHWLFVAPLGRGQFLRIRSANIALALSILTFAFAIIASMILQLARLFNGVCPLLGLADEPPGYGFDGRSPCSAFADEAAPIVLLGVPLLLLVTSAILRIVVSRRRYGDVDEAESASRP